MFWKKKKTLLVKDCKNSLAKTVDKFPFYIGSSADCDMFVNLPEGENSTSVMLTLIDGDIVLRRMPDTAVINFDSANLVQEAKVDDGTVHTLQIIKSLFYIYYGCDTEKVSEIDISSWTVFDARNSMTIAANIPFDAILSLVESGGRDPSSYTVAPTGAPVGFWFRDVFGQIDLSPKTQYNKTSTAAVKKIDEEFGELICPSCWLRFNVEDMNYISVHADLMGDPLLGEDEKLRFLPSKFNTKGMPLDPMGVPAHEMACPHCHRKLPSTFLSMKSTIVSLVGAPSSGKSYYLSILLNFLPDILFKNFGIAFVDADPPLNAVITTMRNRLFSSRNSDESYLAKTQLEGGMYDRLVRHGKLVSLPKPFVYILRDMKDFANQSSVTFYDNAGEHFEPNISIDDSPGALHVAAADILMFLFDPLASVPIKMRLDNSVDPQLERDVVDQQDIILAEMSNRIKQIKNIENSYELGTPFAFVVNKCDAIASLFDCSQLENPLSMGSFDNAVADRNSAKIREFLLGIVPNVVINAEMISKNIKYFMISPFGHTPHRKRNAAGAEYISPDVSKIRPMFVEVPIIWALSKIDGTPISKSIIGKNKNTTFVF